MGHDIELSFREKKTYLLQVTCSKKIKSFYKIIKILRGRIFPCLLYSKGKTKRRNIYKFKIFSELV